MIGITCLACGWVSYAITVAEAKELVARSSTRSSVDDYGCFRCGGSIFRPTRPGDCPMLSTINPAVCDDLANQTAASYSANRMRSTAAYADGDDGKRLGWRSHHYQLRRVAAVQAVLDEIAAGRHPTTQDLATAPILHGWSWAPHPIRPETDVIWAFGTQHPVVGNSHLYTGRVWSMAVDKSWARTTERFYRLGQPAGRRKIEVADRKNLMPDDALR